MPLIPPMIRTSSSHTRANTTNIFLVGTKKYTAPFPYPGFPCKPHGLLPTGSNFYLSRNTRSYALLPEYSEPCFFPTDSGLCAFPGALGAALFPDGLGIVHLSRDARTALFPKHSDRTFFRSTRIVRLSRSALSRAFSVTITLLGAALFPDGLGIVRLSRSALSRAFSRRTRDRAPFPKRSEPRFFCNDHSARSRAFSVTITLLGAALFPDGLGIMHLPRDARTALFPKHSDRTFSEALGSCFFPTDSGSCAFPEAL